MNQNQRRLVASTLLLHVFLATSLFAAGGTRQVASNGSPPISRGWSTASARQLSQKSPR